MSALPLRKLGALVRGLGKVPRGGTVNPQTVEKVNDVARSNQTTTSATVGVKRHQHYRPGTACYMRSEDIRNP